MRLHSLINNLTLELNKFNCVSCPLHTICDDVEEHSICSLLHNAEATCKVECGDKVKLVNILEFMLQNDLDFCDLEVYYHIKKEDILLLSEAEGEIRHVKRISDGQFYNMRFEDKYIDVHESLVFTIIEHADTITYF